MCFYLHLLLSLAVQLRGSLNRLLVLCPDCHQSSQGLEESPLVLLWLNHHVQQCQEASVSS